MTTISFTLDLPDKYFNIIASKYGFPRQLAQLGKAITTNGVY